MKRIQIILFVSFLFFASAWAHVILSFTYFDTFVSMHQSSYTPHDFMFMGNMCMMFSTLFKYGGPENFSKKLLGLKLIVLCSWIFAIASCNESKVWHYQDSYLLYFIPFLISNYIMLVYKQPAKWLELSSGNLYTEEKRWGNYIS